MLRKCSACGVEKPLNSEHFSERAGRGGPFRRQCRDCRAKINKKWRTKNHKYILSRNEEWVSNNTEYVRALHRRLSKTEKYRQNERDGNKRRYHADPVVRGKRLFRSSLRRKAVARATPAWLADSDFDKIKSIYLECARLTEFTGVPHEVDHIIPVLTASVCGLHLPHNLRIIPKSENRTKGNRWLQEEGLAPMQ